MPKKLIDILVAFTMAGFLLGGVNAAVACEGDCKDGQCKHKDEAKKDSKKDDDTKKK